MAVVASFEEAHVGDAFLLDRERMRFGRSNTCAYNEIVLYDDVRMSRGHGRFELRADGRWWLVDLATANGTEVNGQRIASDVALAPGDRIVAGRVTLVFMPAEPVPPPGP